MSQAKHLLLAASGSSGSAVNVENVFAEFLYAGNAGSNAINNGIDLSTDGGMVIIKRREDNGYNWKVMDTVRGANKSLELNTNAQETTETVFSSFNTNGFTLNTSNSFMNENDHEMASWTFKKHEKFFDIVTYTGTDSSTGPQNISHNLGSVPGMIWVKARDKSEKFTVWHRSSINASEGTTRGSYMELSEASSGASQSTSMWNNTDPTSTVFSVGNNGATNENGKLFVAYLFAHNNSDGIFGESGDQDIIKCGEYTGDGGTGITLKADLGFEPQWILIKKYNQAGGQWYLFDTLRGISVYNETRTSDNLLKINSSDGTTAVDKLGITSSGFFTKDNDASLNMNTHKYIYVAIRRGPMGSPSAATDVFASAVRTTGATAVPSFVANFVVDLALRRNATNGSDSTDISCRLWPRRPLEWNSQSNFAENSDMFDYMTGHLTNSSSPYDNSSMFKRWPKIFDIFTYIGNGSNRTISHNLKVAPQMIWFLRPRSSSVETSWYGPTNGHTKLSESLESEAGSATTSSTFMQDTAPTASVITLGTSGRVNNNGELFSACCFATYAGISFVGSVVISGTTNVDMGFSSSARFVLVKKLSGGTNRSWLLTNSTLGIVSGNDTYIEIGKNNAAITGDDIVDPYSSGITFNGGTGELDDGTYDVLAFA